MYIYGTCQNEPYMECNILTTQLYNSRASLGLAIRLTINEFSHSYNIHGFSSICFHKSIYATKEGFNSS